MEASIQPWLHQLLDVSQSYKTDKHPHLHSFPSSHPQNPRLKKTKLNPYARASSPGRRSRSRSQHAEYPPFLRTHPDVASAPSCPRSRSYSYSYTHIQAAPKRMADSQAPLQVQRRNPPRRRHLLCALKRRNPPAGCRRRCPRVSLHL
jgi:hypothetical protein